MTTTARTLPVSDRRTGAQRILPLAVCALLVVSSVSWRSNIYFSGALDPVVLVKALLSIGALGVAIVAARRAEAGRPVGVRSILLLTVFLVVTCLGGWASGSAFASAVVAVRVILVAATVTLLLHAFDDEVVVGAIVRAMGAVGVFAALTGLPTLSSGRLSGGLPPLSPNGVANLCAIPVLALIWRTVEGRSRGRFDALIMAALMLVIVLTGSRTTLATLLLATLVMVAQMRRLSAPVFVGLVALVPASVYLVFGTTLVSDLASRGGSSNVATLSSRTIAWNAALDLTGTWWQHWFGRGLAMKQIPVTGQYWSTQILDSSWISALVQGGLLGVFLVGAWTVVVVVASIRCGRPWRSLWLGLLVFMLPRSILESGLFDATPDFMLFFLVALMSEPLARSRATDSVDVTPPRARPSPHPKVNRA